MAKVLSAVLSKKHKVGDTLNEGTRKYIVKGVQTIGKNKYLTYFEEKLSNPGETIKSGEWTPAHAVRIRNGKLEILR